MGMFDEIKKTEVSSDAKSERKKLTRRPRTEEPLKPKLKPRGIHVKKANEANEAKIKSQQEAIANGEEPEVVVQSIDISIDKDQQSIIDQYPESKPKANANIPSNLSELTTEEVIYKEQSQAKPVEGQNTSISQPEFNSPNQLHAEIEEDEEKPSSNKNDGGSDKAPRKKREKSEDSPTTEHYRNEALSDLPQKEKKDAAEFMAESIIDAYVMLNDLGKQFCQTTDDKLQLKAAQGKFEYDVLEYPIPLGENTTITVKEFLNNLNDEAERVFVVTEEFKDKVRPLLIEICQEKGWGLTTMQRLIAIAAVDLKPKIEALILIKVNTSNILKTVTNLYKQNKEMLKNQELLIKTQQQPVYNTPPVAPVTPSQPTQQEQQPTFVTPMKDDEDEYMKNFVPMNNSEEVIIAETVTQENFEEEQQAKKDLKKVENDLKKDEGLNISSEQFSEHGETTT